VSYVHIALIINPQPLYWELLLIYIYVAYNCIVAFVPQAEVGSLFLKGRFLVDNRLLANDGRCAKLTHVILH